MSSPATIDEATRAREVSLRCTLRLAAEDRDLEISAPGDATVRDVAAAIARHVGASHAPGRLRSERSGPLREDQPIAAAPVRDGDVLSFSPAPAGAPPARETAPVCELVVTSGPAAGRRIPLGAGTHVVGRDAESAQVVLPDPSLSRRHVELVVDAGGQVTVADAGSSNGTAVEGVVLGDGERRALRDGDHVEAGRSLLAVVPWRSADGTVVSARGQRVAFNRPPRVNRTLDPVTLRLDSPPTAMRKARLPLIAAIVPLIMGLTLWILTKSPFMLVMAAMSPVMMVGTYVSDRRGGRKEHADQLSRFDSAVEQLVADLEAAQRAEVQDRRASLPDAAELVARASRHLPELWERRPADRDFLDVRVGVADQPSTASVALSPGGDPDLRAKVEAIVEHHRTVPAVPVRARLSELGALGLAGDPAAVESLARWIVVQLATLHSPRDLVVTAALSPERAERWAWLGWLPHVTPGTSPLACEHIAVGQRPARELVKEIATLAAERRTEDEGRPGGRGRRRRTTVALLVDDAVAPEATLVDELLEDCGDVQIAVIWLAAEARHLPGGAGAIVELASGRAAGDLTVAATGQRVREMSVDGLAEDTAEEVARSLAPVQDVTAGGGAAEIPRSVSLLELLELAEPTSGAIAQRWQLRSKAGREALLGVAAGDPFSIDLRADGPHALVAGTTGAGKSELLQSLIASLAATHPPNRIAFLLVDYKGGAAFKDCVHLPHSVGMVTDLDEHEVRRALVSLEAELKRREHVLAEAGAKDLIELERRDPAQAPPSLVIVVDEFATLAKEVPAFVEGVVDVAQRGRSLGVHLVLATQRPGNAVTDNIRANTTLRIALRVAGTTESDDVISAPDAARLPRTIPGRALARTGPGELTEFQAAYVGGHTVAGETNTTITVSDLAFGMAVAPEPGGAAAAAPSEQTEGDERPTDLQRLVEAVADACVDLGIQPPPSPWMPPLPELVALDELLAETAAKAVPATATAAGVIDEPRRQRRVAHVIDLERDGNLLVYGATASGKTTFLRTLAAAFAAGASPAQLQVYGLDCAGRGLAGLETLPHCGSVVFAEDEERVARLLGMLRRTIDDRARRFAARGVLNLAEYNAAEPAAAMPRLLVLVDSYAGFLDAYEKVNLGALVDAMPRLVADGRAAGVHFVITGDRRMAIPQSIASVVARRLILRMADEDEYGMLGLDAKEVRGAHLPPGRGFLDDGREVQTALVGSDPAGEQQNAALTALAADLRDRHPHVSAPPVPRLPLALDRATLPAPAHPMAAVIGVDDVDLSPVELSFDEVHAAVIGPYRSGRSTALETIVRSLAPGVRRAGGELHLLAPRRSPLLELDLWASASRGGDAVDERVSALVEALYVRTGEGEPPIVIVIDDAGELAESACAGGLETLIKRGRDFDVRVLAAFETGQARHYAQWIKEIRKDGVGLLLDPNPDLDGELLGVRLPRRSNTLFPPGRGYAVAGGVARLVQVAGSTGG